MPPLRFIIYTRVSTDEQAERGTGLETQEIECRRYVERLDGVVVRLESDPGISGLIYPRPGITSALESLQRGEADAVIALRVNRLGRKASVPLQILETIQEIGCTLWTVEDGEVTDTGIILFALKSGMSQSDHSTIVKQMKDGKRRLAEKGIQPNRSARPFGYRIIHKIEDGRVRDDAGKYELIEAEAAVVKRMFEGYAAGVTLGMLANEFQREGVPTVKPGASWWPITISRMLRNPLYKGEASWGKTITIRKTGKKPRRVASGVPLLCITVPPIVTPELWQQVQERLALNVDHKSRKDRTHLFTGLVRCPICGLNACCITLSSYKIPQVVYKCRYFAPSATPGRRVCNKASYYERDILASLVWTFKTMPPRTSQWVQNALQRYSEKQSKNFNPATLETIRENLKKAEKEAVLLVDAEMAARRRDDDAGLQEIMKRQDEAAEKKKGILSELQVMERISEMKTPEEFKNHAEVIWNVMREVRGTLEDGAHHERNVKLRGMIDRIIPLGEKQYEVYLREFPDVSVSELFSYSDRIWQKGKEFPG